MMRPFASTLALALLAAGPASGATQAQTAAPAAAQAAPASEVDPGSVAALKQMSAYLTSLNTIQITSEGSLDVVDGDGQRIQMDGVINYKIRRPDGFVIDYVSDAKSRRFIYDGKNLTVFAPKLGFYATVDAPPTIRATLDRAYDNFGIKLPLEDLFLWADPSIDRASSLTSGYYVGTATLEGVSTKHYAFRQKDLDWEIWIQQGDQPLPRKIVIVDRSQAAMPTFIARLQWKVNPPLTDADFAFVPDADDTQIEMAVYQGSGN